MTRYSDKEGFEKELKGYVDRMIEQYNQGSTLNGVIKAANGIVSVVEEPMKWYFSDIEDAYETVEKNTIWGFLVDKDSQEPTLKPYWIFPINHDYTALFIDGDYHVTNKKGFGDVQTAVIEMQRSKLSFFRDKFDDMLLESLSNPSEYLDLLREGFVDSFIPSLAE